MSETREEESARTARLLASMQAYCAEHRCACGGGRPIEFCSSWELDPAGIAAVGLAKAALEEAAGRALTGEEMMTEFLSSGILAILERMGVDPDLALAPWRRAN